MQEKEVWLGKSINIIWKYELENKLLVESSGFPANEAQWIDIKDVYIFQIDSLSLQIA